MTHPIDLQNNGMFLVLYLGAVILLIGTLMFAVNVKKIARKKNIY